MDKILDSHKHDVNEAFYRVLCQWREGKGATWAVLLQALRQAGLNAQANKLQEEGTNWGASEVPVSCVVLTPFCTIVEQFHFANPFHNGVLHAEGIMAFIRWFVQNW